MPKVGTQVVVNRLGVCTVTEVLPLGTIEVRSASGRYYRVSGLPINGSIHNIKGE